MHMIHQQKQKGTVTLIKISNESWIKIISRKREKRKQMQMQIMKNRTAKQFTVEDTKKCQQTLYTRIKSQR